MLIKHQKMFSEIQTPCHYLPSDVGLFSCSYNDTDACLIADILDSILVLRT